MSGECPRVVGGTAKWGIRSCHCLGQNTGFSGTRMGINRKRQRWQVLRHRFLPGAVGQRGNQPGISGFNRDDSDLVVRWKVLGADS